MKKTISIIGFKYYLVFSLLVFLTISCNRDSDEANQEKVTGEEQVDDEPLLQSKTFTNPVLNSGPDPWVFKNGDEYFVTFTTGNNITLVRTNKMSDLKNATQKIIWTPPASGFNSSQIWAPELHKIDGKWYIHYAASNGENETHRMWVLENTNSDPFLGNWVDKGKLMLPDDKWAIDGSPFELKGKHYYIWSGWEGDNNVRQDIYIAEMKNPITVIGKRTRLLKPLDSWEINGVTPQVVEGPQFLLKNNKVFIFYSAGGCWKDGYSIGAISMDVNSNPMDASSWSRLATNPLFVSNNTGNAFGPGHNSFFKSLNNDEDWILYHANPQAEQGCGSNRSVRMQKIVWDTNGFPLLGSPEPVNKKLIKPSGEY